MNIAELRETTKNRAFWQGFSSVFTPPTLQRGPQRPLRLPKVQPRTSADPWERAHEILREATKTVLGDEPCKTNK